MSGSTLAGIVVAIVSLVTIVVVAAMFLWAAREDGRDQRRSHARSERTRGGR